MKICNNCNSENHNEVHKCIHCQMADDFRPKADEWLHAPHQTDEQARQCINCGHPKPGEGPKCMHCHFPLPDGEKPVRAVPKLTIHQTRHDLFRKTGH